MKWIDDHPVLTFFASLAIGLGAFAAFPPRAVHAQERPHITVLADGSWTIPISSGLGPPLHLVRRFITDDMVCDSTYSDTTGQRTGLHCWRRGYEPPIPSMPLPKQLVEDDEPEADR